VALLRLQGLQRHFPGSAPGLPTRVALAGVDLAVREGEVVSLLGPSGCGKSTVLRLVAGLDRPTAGQLWRAPGLDQALGMVFQDAALMPWATVRENVALPLRLRGRWPGHQAATEVDDALRLVGLADAAQALPGELSGGMKMRASLVVRPRVWLLDEPFGALDEITRFALNQALLDLCRPTAGAPGTALFVTHSVYEAVYLSTRVVVMARPGRVTDEIAIDAPYPRRPDWRGTAQFNALCVQVSQALQRAAEAGVGMGVAA